MPGIFDYGKQYKGSLMDVFNTKHPAIDATAPAEGDRKNHMDILGQITGNTSRTAKNTQKQIQGLRRFVVGGSVWR